MKRTLLLFMLSAALLSNSSAQNFYQHPAWAKNANIYEVNVRQYTPQGTFKAFETQLPRLKEMGVDILWLMPIYSIGVKERKGSLGSYYAVKDYQAVNPEFGTMDDFKQLVNKAHQMGFKVILDWVANHSAPDNKMVTEQPDWYTHDSTGKIVPPVSDWTDVADFNYDSKGLRDYQIESFKYWIKNADVDGFRCDVAMMVPLDFWKQVRVELDKVKPVFMLAEAEGPEFHRNGFDMTYSWELHSIMNKVAQGKANATELAEYFHKNDSLYERNDYRMNFTSNHDENSWNGTEYERMGKATEVLAAFTFVVPGMPLIYTGQESAETRRLRFFDKDTVYWKNFPLAAFYKKLLQLKKQNPALWNGTDGGKIELINTGNKNIFSFSRTVGNSTVIAAFNLSAEAQNVQAKNVKEPGIYMSFTQNKLTKVNATQDWQLKPWGYEILIKDK